jgi:hypothetical protein
MKQKEGAASPPELAARCHEIQTGLGTTEVPEFGNLLLVGMSVRLALHVRGLASIPYDVIKLVGYHYLGISTHAIREVLGLLGEVEFVKLGTEGKTIKTVVPNVPYYEDLYEALGNYADVVGLNDAEQLSVEIVQRLSRSPAKLDALRNALGVDKADFKRAIQVGEAGSYLRTVRARGRNIILTPTYFSENPDVYADAVAAGGAQQIQKLLAAITGAQGYPLKLVEKHKRLGQTELTDKEIRMLIRLAQDGVVKPPSIKTPHAGENFFLFTPTPAGAALSATKRDIYEKAMAIVAAVRQGQFLPRAFAIREPGAVLYTLRRDLRLSRATTEAAQQYKNLVHLRVAHLADAGHGYKQLHIIDTDENREALDIVYALVNAGVAKGIEVDAEARQALQQEQTYVESLISAGKLQKTKKVPLTEQQEQQLAFTFLR